VTRLFEAKPFIIAEVGSNWRTLSDCIESIGRAKACGADAVKFQAFTDLALYGFDSDAEWEGLIARTCEIAGCPREEYSWRVAHHLPLEWLPKLKEKADACGIEFLCTAFSPELVAAVDPYVSVHKVASSDLSYPQLLEAVAKTGKPVLLSTGASSETDIRLALEALGGARERAVLMYCVSSYPSRTYNLDSMRLLRERYGCQVGFSDHSNDVVWAPLSSCRAPYSAVAIEKHFTAFPGVDTPDRPHSLDPIDFKHMVDAIRHRDNPLPIGPLREERDMILRHNRRLIATADILEGAILEYGRNFGAYRSLEDDSRGLTPFAWQQVEGKTAKVAIQRGKGIGPGDFGG
jgi:sialic acid synthase SpsE